MRKLNFQRIQLICPRLQMADLRPQTQFLESEMISIAFYLIIQNQNKTKQNNQEKNPE